MQEYRIVCQSLMHWGHQVVVAIGEQKGELVSHTERVGKRTIEEAAHAASEKLIRAIREQEWREISLPV